MSAPRSPNTDPTPAETPSELGALLRHLLGAPAAPSGIRDLGAWRERHAAAASPFTHSIARAAAGGFAADRLGYAFGSGYSEALRRMVPELGTEPAALCATEEGGAHPRAIAAQLVPDPTGAGWQLSGRKGFVTFGTLAQQLLVVARLGPGADPGAAPGVDMDPGRVPLVVVRIPAARSGVVIQPMPPLGFVPEIPHAGVTLTEVAVAPHERLPGDGYEGYLKPFRTLEDCHVMAALLGYLLQIARGAGWPRPVLQELALLLTVGYGLGGAPPLEPAVHVALGAWLEQIERLLATCEPLWSALDADTRARWERDRPLLRVAGKVRAQRLAAAWSHLAPEPTR